MYSHYPPGCHFIYYYCVCCCLEKNCHFHMQTQPQRHIFPLLSHAVCGTLQAAAYHRLIWCFVFSFCYTPLRSMYNAAKSIWTQYSILSFSFAVFFLSFYWHNLESIRSDCLETTGDLEMFEWSRDTFFFTITVENNRFFLLLFHRADLSY